ncbi:unnamed protein product [Boreogadus saida]
MEAEEKTLLGLVHGKFKFKPPDGTVDSITVICNLCSVGGGLTLLSGGVEDLALAPASARTLRPDPQGEAPSQLGTGPVSQRCSPVWFHTVWKSSRPLGGDSTVQGLQLG